jgi:hypothetical protein
MGAQWDFLDFDSIFLIALVMLSLSSSRVLPLAIASGISTHWALKPPPFSLLNLIVYSVNGLPITNPLVMSTISMDRRLFLYMLGWYLLINQPFR